jgi:transcriptional regulator with XRE-family HTH domain
MVTAQQFNSPYHNLKIIIEKQEQTQKDVADKMDMNRSTFNLKINRTNGRDFSLEEAKRLSEILEISIDNFF